MKGRTRSNVVGGLLLILLGLLFLAYQFAPEQFAWLQIEVTWPLIVVGVGLFLLVLGLLVGAPGMAVPAAIVGGIGGLLYWQNLTGNWGSWAYAWALIPGFVGVGIILASLLGEGKIRDAIGGGGTLILISAVMFAIFGSFLGGLELLGNWWPILIILVGLLVLARSFFRRS